MAAASKNKIEIILSAIDQGVTATFAKVNRAIAATEQTTARYGKAMDALKAPINAATSAMSGLIAAVGSGLLARSLWDAGVKAQQLEMAFKAIAGTGAAAEMAFVRAEADRLGQSLPVVSDAYKGILASSKGSNLEGEKTRKIFTAIMEATTALGLSADKTQGSLYAVSQMMSKGKVAAEELRGQLGERLPGAVPLFAEAMGVTTAALDAMLQRGEVGTEALVKFADTLHNKYGAAAESAAQGAIGAQNRLATAWYDLKVAISNSGFLDQAAGYMRNLADAINDPATRAAIVDFAKRFFEFTDSVIKAAWEWKGFIAGFAGVTLAVSAVATLTTAIQGLVAGFQVLGGIKGITWLATYIRDVQIASANTGLLTTATFSLGKALTTIGGLAAAAFAGWEMGKLLGQFDPIQKGMLLLIYTMDLVQLAARKMWAKLTGSDADVKAVEQKVANSKQVYGEMLADINAGKGAGEREQKKEEPGQAPAAPSPPPEPEQKKADVGYRTPDYLDQLDPAVLSPAELEDRKKRWAEREQQEKQLNDEKNTRLDEVAKANAAEDEKRAAIRAADAKRQADKGSVYYKPEEKTYKVTYSQPEPEPKPPPEKEQRATDEQIARAQKTRQTGESHKEALDRIVKYDAAKEKEDKHKAKNKDGVIRRDAFGNTTAKTRSKSSDQILTKKEIAAQKEVADAVKAITDESEAYRLKSIEEQTAAAKEAADKQAAAQKEGVGKMQSVFEQYAERVKKIQGEIAGREKSLADELADLDPHTTEEQRWRRKAKAAADYEKAAKAAMAAGRLDEARDYADQAKTTYAGLKGGSGNISDKLANRTAFSGVSSAGTLGLNITKMMTDAAAKAAKASISGIDGLNSRVSGQLQKAISSMASAAPTGPGKQAPVQVHELRLGKAKLQGSADDVADFVKQLELAGMRA